MPSASSRVLCKPPLDMCCSFVSSSMTSVLGHQLRTGHQVKPGASNQTNFAHHLPPPRHIRLLMSPPRMSESRIFYQA